LLCKRAYPRYRCGRDVQAHLSHERHQLLPVTGLEKLAQVGLISSNSVGLHVLARAGGGRVRHGVLRDTGGGGRRPLLWPRPLLLRLDALQHILELLRLRLCALQLLRGLTLGLLLLLRLRVLGRGLALEEAL
jgi:hypothetical protein